MKISFSQESKRMVEKCWETAVTIRLAKSNYRGVSFGFPSSNCTKNVVSYPIIPPPNPPLNLLDSSYKPTMILYTIQNIILVSSSLPLLKFTKN